MPQYSRIKTDGVPIKAWVRGVHPDVDRHPKLDRGRQIEHLGTLGTGNHIIELCLDEARADQLGIVPGSMGAQSYIVRGLGNPESFHSCSHGAGRVMSRNEAKRRFTIADQEAAATGVECRKDAAVLNETPMAVCVKD